MVSITSKPIDPASILEQVSTPESGGIDIFIGTVRNHSDGKRVQRLEYSAYVPMAEKIMAQIEHEIKEKWETHSVAIVHRVGGLSIGEIAVVTAVSAAHRNEAFEACRFAIDRIKSVVPIWKKEYFEGEVKWSAGGEG
jgi:molybdopterin synthase catalytic subunit